jgi:hypothetical protein
MADLFFQRRLFQCLDADGIEVYVPGKDGDVLIAVDEDAGVPALIEMPYPLVRSIVIAGVGDVKVPHEFGKIAEGCFEEEMEVIGHEDVAKEFDGVNIDGLVQDAEKAMPICIAFENVFSFVSPAGDVVHSAGVLNA